MWDKQLGSREKWYMKRFAVATHCCQIDPSSISRHSCGKDVISVQSCQTTSDLTASNSSFYNWYCFSRFDISMLNFKHSKWGTMCFVAPVVKVSHLKDRMKDSLVSMLVDSILPMRLCPGGAKDGNGQSQLDGLCRCKVTAIIRYFCKCAFSCIFWPISAVCLLLFLSRGNRNHPKYLLRVAANEILC